MTFQKQMEARVNEQVAEALACKVRESLESPLARILRITTSTLKEQYGGFVSEVVALRKRSEQSDTNTNQLFRKLVDLERKLNDEIEARRALRQLEQDTLTKLNRYLDQWV